MVYTRANSDLLNRMQQGVPHRFSVVILFTLFCVCLALFSPRASYGDVFEVNGIEVDITADTAAKARQIALQQAERRAFYSLINRLTLPEDQERIPELDSADIATYVRDFAVNQEKSSTIRYIASLSYRFDPDRIRDLLRSFAVPFAETRSRPLLVLPVFEVGARTVLWDEPNPWRLTWEQKAGDAGLVPLVLPLGDLTDIATLGAPEALAGDTAKLTVLADRYATATAMVAHLNIAIDPATGQQQAIISLLRPNSPLPIDARAVSYAVQPGENLDALVTRLVSATIERIDTLWKLDNMILSSGTGLLAVTVPITGLQDWLSIKAQLNQVGVVRRTEVVLISRDQVRINIHFAGSSDQLATALEQANLSMLQEAGEWIVMPIGVFQPPRT